MNRLIVNLLKYWNGNVNAGNAYALYYAPATLLSWLALDIVAEMYLKSGFLLTFVGILLVFMLTLYSYIGAWRCAEYTKSKSAAWKYTGRIAITFFSAPTALMLAMMLVM